MTHETHSRSSVSCVSNLSGECPRPQADRVPVAPSACGQVHTPKGHDTGKRLIHIQTAENRRLAPEALGGYSPPIGIQGKASLSGFMPLTGFGKTAQGALSRPL